MIVEANKLSRVNLEGYFFICILYHPFQHTHRASSIKGNHNISSFFLETVHDKGKKKRN
jgi:hypothetical protein